MPIQPDRAQFIVEIAWRDLRFGPLPPVGLSIRQSFSTSSEVAQFFQQIITVAARAGLRVDTAYLNAAQVVTFGDVIRAVAEGTDSTGPR